MIFRSAGDFPEIDKFNNRRPERRGGCPLNRFGHDRRVRTPEGCSGTRRLVTWRAPFDSRPGFWDDASALRAGGHVRGRPTRRVERRVCAETAHSTASGMAVKSGTPMAVGKNGDLVTRSGFFGSISRLRVDASALRGGGACRSDKSPPTRVNRGFVDCGCIRAASNFTFVF